MKKLSVLTLCILLAFTVACSQNSKKRTAGAMPVNPTPQTAEQAPEGTPGEGAHANIPATKFEVNKEGVDSSITALYKGITIRLTDRKTKQSKDIVIPFSTPTKLEGTPLTVTVTQFYPDFMMSETGYGTRTNEPNNPGAKVKIEGGTPEFDGWLFVNFPDIHPYDNPDYNVVLINAVKK